MSSSERTRVRKQDPKQRILNFEEVSLGYSLEEAIIEAGRCLQCKDPSCVEGCPVGVDIPDFVDKICRRQLQAAGEIIRSKNSLPAICGRVCPQEDQCEASCVLGRRGQPLAIGRLERFVADSTEPSTNEPPSNLPAVRRRVAVIGAGPAGLTAAAELAKRRHKVTIFEALHEPGGVLTYGIPEFRLPKDIVRKETKHIEQLGVQFRTDAVVGKLYTIDELLDEGYDAVFIATGAGSPRFLDIPGEDLNGVLSANEFLTKSNLMRAHSFPDYDTPMRLGERVVIVGGGNVAIDSARTALRFGAKEVILAYRRSREEMPARHEEVENAQEEGVKFMFLATPTKILSGEASQVAGIEFQSMMLGERGPDGRRKPVPIRGETFTMEVQTVIVAIGCEVNPIVQNTTPNLVTNERGHITVEKLTGKTSRERVYAGGDVTTGSDTVIQAMGAGKRAAEAIDLLLKSIPMSTKRNDHSKASPK